MTLSASKFVWEVDFTLSILYIKQRQKQNYTKKCWEMLAFSITLIFEAAHDITGVCMCSDSRNSTD
jgi:hypothetical protein